MSFWGELKRRNVFKVGAAYVIVAWLIVQVANTFFPLLNFPQWAVPMIAVLVILGLPVTLIIAWAFELTPEGVKRSEDVPTDESITHVTGRRLNYIVTGLLVVAVAYIVFDNFYLDRRFIETEVATRVAELVPPTVERKEAVPETPTIEDEAIKSIAVLPFANLSSDPEQEYFVYGLSEEILNSLTKVPDLYVTSRTSSFYFKNSDTTIQKIADVLKVSYILEGSVRKAGNALRITAQLIRVSDDRHLWSETYDRELKDIFALQEDIAKTVADELKLTLGISGSLKQLGGTDNEKAYEYYLVAKGQQYDITAISRTLELLDAAIAMDPEFARAWALKAALHIAQAALEPGGLADSNREDAQYAAQKAVDLAPGMASGYASLGFTKMSRGEWIGAESAFHKAIELSDETLSSDEIFLAANYYLCVGYFKKTVDILAEWRQKDPLNPNLRWAYLEALILSGDHQRANEEFESGQELFGDQWLGNDMYMIATLRPGIEINVDPDEMNETTTMDRIVASGFTNLESPGNGLMELRRLYQNEKELSGVSVLAISIFAAYLGDYDFAMDAMEKDHDIESGLIQYMWLPIFHEVRQTPRFKEFVREIGFVDYWEQFDWPDLCHPTDDGDFECD